MKNAHTYVYVEEIFTRVYVKGFKFCREEMKSLLEIVHYVSVNQCL